jgi:predicted SnoaL-like aldol condensation-catalyzing enzyme
MKARLMRSRLAALMAVAVAITAITMGCTSSRFLVDAELARTNTHTVLAFEETVYNKHHVKEGFDRYVGPTFKQHNPTLPDDKDAAITALTNLITNVYPGSRIVVERTVAQGDLVAAQLFWDQKPGDGRGVSMVEIYRLENGKIVEHWGVAQPLAEKPANDSSVSSTAR